MISMARMLIRSKFIFQTIFIGLLVLSLTVACQPDTVVTTGSHSHTEPEPEQTGLLWAPYVEWSFVNSDYSGNPFDLVASATFIHTVSGETRSTEMFYAGHNIWKLRFTGTRTGEWVFSTTSNDPDLDGRSGTVIINSNPDNNIKGFLTSYGNKFARQIGEDGELEGLLFNVYMNHDRFPSHGGLNTYRDASIVNSYLDEAEDNGFETIFTSVNNEWFKLGARSYNEHNSVDPDFESFQCLETLITLAHQRGLHVHIWAWGDEDRKWTPIGVGGINGIPDRRVQRYIAARLGPLPGWSMGYGFDLFEWVSASQVESWGNYIHERMGWPHLLMAREEASFWTPDNMDVLSNDERPAYGFYSYAVDRLSESPTRPVLFSRRFLHTRDNVWTMETTRRALWQFTMAGGAGGWWGPMWDDGPQYSNPEQLVTHRYFWHGRFLLEMERANDLTDGHALKDGSTLSYVFYKEDANSIQIDLSGMVGPQRAVAVDTRLAYVEIDLGILAPTNHTWNAPYQSDWAIAVGDFDRQATVASDFQAKPLDLPNSSYLPLITRGIAVDRCGY